MSTFHNPVIFPPRSINPQVRDAIDRVAKTYGPAWKAQALTAKMLEALIKAEVFDILDSRMHFCRKANAEQAQMILRDFDRVLGATKLAISSMYPDDEA